MKLITPEWRSAWYEEGLSERFAQEMSRLEKTTVRELGTTAQWVEQMVIELGQLTQNMIHLEGELSRPPQVRLAVEKALKLAALAAHLTAALDQALDKGPAVLRYTPDQVLPGSMLAHISTGNNGGAPAMEPFAGATVGGAPFAQHLAPAPVSPLIGSPSIGPPPAQPAAAHTATSFASTQAPGMRVSAQVQIGLQRQAAALPPGAAVAAPSAAPKAALISPLMDISQPLIADNPSPVREMILALSRRGLSRSEIEVITEQPRHIIEAVLSAG